MQISIFKMNYNLRLRIPSDIKRSYFLAWGDKNPIVTKLMMLSVFMLNNTQYETFIGGLPPSLNEESEAPYVGCMRDIRVLDTDRDLQDLQLTGATVEECGLNTLDFSTPTFQGFLLGVICRPEHPGRHRRQHQSDDLRVGRKSQELFRPGPNYGESHHIASQLDRVRSFTTWPSS